VDQAVDVVGEGGKNCWFSKTLQAYLLSSQEWTDLTTENYVSLWLVLEGFVILKNLEYHED
jgi:hypothetical protein